MRAESSGLKIVDHEYDDLEVAVDEGMDVVEIRQGGETICIAISDAVTFAKILTDFAKKL